MAPAAPFASIDAAALYGEEADFLPHASVIARRSISIFSRKGTETPEPKPPFIAQAAIRVPKQMSEKQKGLMKRKSGPSTTVVPKPKTTILNAVPAAKKIQMTALEEEMATSPNEEILTAVSGSPTQTAFKHSPTQRMGSFWNKSNTALTQRTTSQACKDTKTRIGVWVHGVVHWDDQAIVDRVGWEEPSLQADTGFSPLMPLQADGLNASLSGGLRPMLSVVIPSSEPLINDTTISTIVQSMPRRPVVSVAPASIVSTFATPSLTVDESYEISPLESTPRHATVNLDRGVTVAYGGTRQSGSSSSSTWEDRDDSSVLSQRSSATSIEALTRSGTPSKDNGVVNITGNAPPNYNKPLPPSPIPLPQRAAPTAPCLSALQTSGRAERSLSARSAPADTGRSMLPPSRNLRASCSLSHLDEIETGSKRSTAAVADDSASPTLSQIEKDLEARLSTISESSSVVREDDYRDDESTMAYSGSTRISNALERVPTVPRRSRKREWRTSHTIKRAVQFNHSSAARRRRSESNLAEAAEDLANLPTLRKSTSAANLSTSNRLSLILQASNEEPLPPLPSIVIDDGLIVVHGPMTMYGRAQQSPPVSSASAENVLLCILSALDSTADLFNTALINKGMYRVYKENEMHLIRTVSFNQSPAAWEFREWSPPIRHDEAGSGEAPPRLEYTAQSYMRCLRRDLEVIESLKALILDHCQSFIRRETAFALSTPTHPNAQRFNDAFWRIWCFCNIFGYGKGREEDVTGQLDWLKGGVLANNEDLTATMNMNLDFDMGSVLLNPPDCFAKGNASGLTAKALYDMSEIWACFVALLQGFQGRVDQARQNGVFLESEIFDGDEEKEEQVLEEWTAHLLTLGPAVILEMAELAYDPSPAGFVLAKMNGWTQWNPDQCSGSRTTFLKEPVSRLYEERVATSALRIQNPKAHELREQSRKRVANLAAEIKLARQASCFKRRPFIDASMERQMSVCSRHDSTMSTHSVRPETSSSARRVSSPIQGNRPPNFSVPYPRSPPLNLWSPRKISPIIEERIDTFNRISLQNFGNGLAEDPSDRAIKRIMDMGFSQQQAREALKMTDLGHGLQLDRAVDLLLRQQ